MHNISSINFKRISEFVLYILTIIFSFSIIYSLNKGFDITDEGFYLLASQKKQIIPMLSQFNILVTKIFFFIDLKVIHFRWINLFSHFFGNIFLSFSLSFWLKRHLNIILNCKQFVGLLFFISLASFIEYSWLPNSFGYNNLNRFLTVVITGLIFICVESKRHGDLFLIIINCLSVFQMLTKITSGLLIFIAGNVIILAYRSNFTKKTFFIFLSKIVFGLVAGLFLLQVITGDSLKCFSPFMYYLENTADNGSPKYSMFRQMEFIFGNLLSFLKLLLFALFINVCIYLNFKYKYLNRYLTQFNKFILYLLLFTLTYSLFFISRTNTKVLYFLCFFNVFLACQKMIFRQHSEKVLFKKTFLMITLLLSLPIIVSIGTNVDYWCHTAGAAQFLFCIILILEKISIDSTNKILMRFFLYGIVSYYFIQGFIFFPYRSSSLIHSQFVSASLKNLKGINVEKYRNQTLNQVNNTLHKYGYSANDTIIGIYKLPGIIYAVNANSNGRILWDPNTEDEFITNLKDNPPNLQNTYLLWQDKPSKLLKKTLRDIGINSTTHTNVQTVYNYFNNKYIHVFVPKK